MDCWPYSEIIIAFMPADTLYILQDMDKRMIWISNVIT